MIFNKKFNNIIDLMQETDSEFNEIYAEFASRLPENILIQCQKCKDFNTEINNIGYDLETALNGDVTIELSVDNYSKDIGFLLTVEVFNKDILDNYLEICESEEEEKSSKVWILGGFEIEKATKVINYSFILKKTADRQYCIVLNKTNSSNEKETRRTEKTYSYEELLKKITIKSTRK